MNGQAVGAPQFGPAASPLAGRLRAAVVGSCRQGRSPRQSLRDSFPMNEEAIGAPQFGPAASPLAGRLRAAVVGSCRQGRSPLQSLRDSFAMNGEAKEGGVR
jgi:hypothetical protein